MTFAHRFRCIALVSLAGVMLGVGPAGAQNPPPPSTLDEQMMNEAEQQFAAGKYKEAAAEFDLLVSKYPQVPRVPEANFRGGYSHYLAGEYEEALTDFRHVIEAKNLAPDYAQIYELALSLSPQVMVAKAAKMQPDDQRRKSTLEEAVRQFDAYLQKYPNSEEAESATQGKATALFQVQRYDEAVTALRGNLTKFAQSPTVQDSKYLLAITLAAAASNAKEKPNAPNAAAADAQFDDAENQLREIIGRPQSLALSNDSRFQLGEIQMARGGFLSKPEEKQKQNEMFSKALDAFRNVASKDAVVAAQKQRIAQFADLQKQRLAAKDIPGFQRYRRLIDKETERLAQIEQTPDQTLTAKLRTGVIFFSENKWDETRVFYTHLNELGLIEDANDKKQADYFVVMSYAAQNVIDKAVEKYDAFESAHRADAIAESLPLAMGAMFLDEKHKDPEKAIHYFSEGIEMYPKGKLLGAMVLARAGAQIELKQYDEAAKALTETLAANPPVDLARDADFYLGTIYTNTGKINEAIAQFKKVREKYPKTLQAEQAHFQVGQMLVEKDAKSAIEELSTFFKNYPNSQYMPSARFAYGKAQAALGKNAEAIATFKKVADDYSTSDPAPFSYFERAKILLAEQKFDDCLAVMKEFLKKYPDKPGAMLFQAYDFIAQIQTTKDKGGTQAIDTYQEFVDKHPKDPTSSEALLKLAVLWKTYAESQGPYLALGEGPKREEWKKGVQKSAEAAERLLKDFPESQQVAKALNTIMETQRLQQQVRLKSKDDIEKFFQDLAAKFSDKPETRAKILFTLAAFIFDEDKAKAVKQMAGAYKPDLKLAPEDLDLYGQALIESKKIDEALKVYEKLDADYKITGDPKKAPLETQQARAIVLAGEGKAYQAKGEAEKGGKLFSELEKNFPWSPKMLEVNYGIASALHVQHKDDEAISRLQEVIKAPKASAELRAKSMLLLGDIHKANNRTSLAIDNYIKISLFFGGVPKIASEGLWRGAQLLEEQAKTGMPPTPTPKPTATAKPAGSPAGAPKPAGAATPAGAAKK